MKQAIQNLSHGVFKSLLSIFLSIIVSLLLVSPSAIAQGVEARRAAKEAAAPRKAEAMRQMRLRVKAEPFWNYQVNDAMQERFGIVPNATALGNLVDVNRELIMDDQEPPQPIPVTLKDIVTYRYSGSIRADGLNCVFCHGRIASQGELRLDDKNRQQFCELVPGLLNVNVAVGNNGHKPQSIKDFFGRWFERGCSDQRGPNGEFGVNGPPDPAD